MIMEVISLTPYQYKSTNYIRPQNRFPQPISLKAGPKIAEQTKTLCRSRPKEKSSIAWPDRVSEPGSRTATKKLMKKQRTKNVHTVFTIYDLFKWWLEDIDPSSGFTKATGLQRQEPRFWCHVAAACLGFRQMKDEQRVEHTISNYYKATS
jgi:hypothetical protein